MSGVDSAVIPLGDNSATSSELLKKAADGNRHAWQQLLDQYRRLILSWCFAVGLQPVDAEDVFQEVWTAVFRRLPSFERRSPGAFRRWLFSVTQSKLADFFRSLKGRVPSVGGTDFQQLLRQIADAEDPSESSAVNQSALEARQLAVLAGDAIRQQVDEVTWDAFFATEIEKRAAKDVADELGVSVNVVYISRSRCKQRLLAIMKTMQRQDGSDGIDEKDSSVH